MSAPPRSKTETKPLATGLDLSVRLRRNRKAEWSRRLVREHELTINDLIWPIFVIEGDNRTQAVGSSASSRVWEGSTRRP